MHSRVVALVLALAVAAAGCGSDDRERLPAACTAGPGAIAKALAAAPGAVRIDGVAISHCFTRGASGTDEQLMGGNLLAVAQRLHDAAATDPEGRAALQLGYLLGAVRRGASRSGVHAELARRLQMEQVDVRSAAFARGRRAGGARG
jgi:hypothetical protein